MFKLRKVFIFLLVFLGFIVSVNASILFQSNNMSNFTTIETDWDIYEDYIKFNASGTNRFIKLTYDPVPSSYYVSFEIKEETISGEAIFQLCDSVGCAAQSVYTYLADDWHYYVASWNNLNTNSGTTWHNVTFLIHEGNWTFDFWQDEIKYLSAGGFRNNNPVSDFQFRGKGSADDLWIKNFCIYTNSNDECFGSGSGSTITTNIKEYYNETPILIELNESSGVIGNFSYVLDGGALTLIESNVNTTNLNITLTEGQRNFSWYFDNVNVLNETTIIDLTPPNITVIGSIVQDFLVNFSTIFNVTDSLSGVASCTLNATYLENVTNASQYNRFVNCSDTVHFNAAGVYEGFLFAQDNAGNIATLRINGTIQPFIYFNFFESNGSQISNYSANILQPDGFLDTFTNKNNPLNVSPFNNNTLDLGNYTIQFSKLGYITTNFSVDINETSGGTVYNFTISDAVISLIIKDKFTNELINGTNFTIALLSNIGLQTSTVTGYKNISNTFLTSGEVRITVSNNDYFTEDIFFNFNNEELIEQTIYLTNINESNAGVVIIEVLDNLGQPRSGILVQALQWNPSLSTFVKVSEGQTGLDGKSTLNVILEDKIYVFKAIDGDVTETSPQYRLLSTDNGKTISLTIGDAVGERSYLFQNLNYNIRELSYVNNISTLRFDWEDINGLSTTVCFATYRYRGLSETFLNRNCTTGSSGSHLQAFNLNTSNNILIKGQVKLGDSYYTLKTFDYPSQFSLPSLVISLNFTMFVIPILFLVALALGIYLTSVHLGVIFSILAAGFSIYLVPSLLTGGIVAFLMGVNSLILWAVVGGRR